MICTGAPVGTVGFDANAPGAWDSGYGTAGVVIAAAFAIGDQVADHVTSRVEGHGAHRLGVSGGRQGHVEPAALNRGTVVELRDLFFARPALPSGELMDLAAFWSGAYHEVKKELQGRYPKHHWPDQPLQAQATARTRRRR